MKLNPFTSKRLPVFFRSQKFYSLFSSVFNSAIALLTFSLMARALTKGEFGYWALFLTIYGIIEMTLNGLIKTPVIRMAANEDYDFKSVIASTWDLVMKFILMLSAGASLILGIIGYATEDSYLLKISIWVLVYGIVVIPQTIGRWVTNATMKFQHLLVIRFISVGLFLIGIVLVYHFEKDINYVFIAYLTANGLTSLMVLILGWSHFKYYLQYKKVYNKEILNFGKFSLGASIGSIALTNSDSIIIMSFLGPASLAIYEIPKRIKKLHAVPLMGILQLSFPYFSKKFGKVSDEELKIQFQRILGFALITLSPLSVLIFVFADWLVLVLGGEQYADAGIIVQIFALLLFITPFDRLSGIVLNVTNRPKYNLRKYMIVLIVNIVGDLIVIMLGYGVVGVAAITLITKMSGIAYSYYVHRRELPFNIPAALKQGFIQCKLITKEFRS